MARVRAALLAALCLGAAALGARASGFDDIPFDDIPRPGSAEDMRIVWRMASSVDLYRLEAGRLVSIKIPVAELRRTCPRCLNLDGRHYFADWAAFAARPGAEAVRSAADARAAARGLVNACLQLAPAGTEVPVRGTYPSLCRKPKDKDPGLTRRGTTSYSALVLADGLHLRATVRLNPKALSGSLAEGRAAQMAATARACLPEVRSFWARYAIIFDLTLESTAENPELPADLTVDLVDATEDHKAGRRSDETTYYLTGSTTDELCRRIIHETGHMLGMDDETNRDCPDRPFVASESNPWSVMDDIWHPLPDLELFPRHIIKVLRPLCARPKERE